MDDAGNQVNLLLPNNVIRKHLDLQLVRYCTVADLKLVDSPVHSHHLVGLLRLSLLRLLIFIWFGQKMLQSRRSQKFVWLLFDADVDNKCSWFIGFTFADLADSDCLSVTLLLFLIVEATAQRYYFAY